MSTAAANAAKKQRGRPFKPGRSGNPAGKAKGTRHRVTVLAEQMMEDEASAVVTAVLEAAKAGDMTAARIILDRIAPARRGRPVKFTLPALETAAEIVRGLGAIITAVADGTLTPDEAAAVAKFNRDEAEGDRNRRDRAPHCRPGVERRQLGALRRTEAR